MRTPFLVTSLVLSALTVMPACGGDSPPGSLVVPFRIGADVPCADLEVQDVTVDLVKPGSTTSVTTIASQTVACDEGQAEFTGLASGSFEIRATGMTADGIVVVDNFDKDPADKAEITSGAQNTADDTVLRTTPAKVQVRWILGGGLDMCTDVPVADFEVIAYKNDGATELLAPYTFACDPIEEKTTDKYFPIVDEAREIEGDVLDLITIEPLDASGKTLLEATAKPIRFGFAPVGHGRFVKITINVDCAADSCTLSCPNVDPMDAANCLADG